MENCFRPRLVALLAICSCCILSTTTALAAPDVFDNVPEATSEGYQLVYTLPIEDQAGYSTPGSVPYSVDNTATLTGPFDRVAYYLELDTGSGLEFVWVSMDAFTTNINHIGLPIASHDVYFQQVVANMNVLSNSANVTNGTGLATGNIEFWPNNYGVFNQIAIPGASDDNYDAGDTRDTGGSYGSFQIHNHGAGETLLAYNQWGGINPQANGDLGIGNAPNAGLTDWTFSQNTSSYVVKNLQILVRPSSLSIPGGMERTIFQRNEHNLAAIPLSGFVAPGITSVQARALLRSGSGVTTDWTVIDPNPVLGGFAGTLNLFAGWYDLEIRSMAGAQVVGQISVQRVGVGDVYITAGQSNSANHGSDLLAPFFDQVSCFDLSGWRQAADPQPIATGIGGSPWPALGDAMVSNLGVPVGFISVGWGGTSVGQWVPGAPGPDIQPLYERLRAALQAVGPDGARAVLWHQGESDNVFGTTTEDYAQALETVIAQSRIDAGFAIPWGIAQASFVPGWDPQISKAVIAAQAQVAANDPLNFVGPMTDDLTGLAWRAPDLIHFNEAGLREHAERWQVAINSFFTEPGIPFQPVASKFLDGLVSGGQISDLISSDDVYWLLDPNPTSNPFKQKIDLILLGESTTLTPSTLSFCLECSMVGGPSGDVKQTIWLYNFATMEWEIVDLRAAATSDEPVLVHPTGDLTRYVDPVTGEILARATWESPGFDGLPFNWSIDLDQAIWLIAE